MNNVKNDTEKHNKISEKKLFKNYNSFLQINHTIPRLNDNKNILKDEIYINIDSEYNLTKQNKKKLDIINEKIKFFKEEKHNTYKDEEGNIIKDVVRYILSHFLSKLYPKCPINVCKISQFISKEYYLKKNYNDKSGFKIEENINYFFNSRYEYKYSTVLKFNKMFFTNCGKILINIYSKFKIDNISEAGGLRVYRNSIIDKNINVLSDFFNYCNEKGYDPNFVEKTYVWKYFESKYDIPPELIFLFNIFQEINTLDIDIEFGNEILNEEDFSLFAISLLNSIYIFSKLDYIKINLINSHLQYYIYEQYYNKVLRLLKIGKEYIKKNIFNDKSFLYENKWNFIYDFNLDNYRKKMQKNNKYRKGRIIYDKYSMLYKYELKNNLLLKNVMKHHSVSNIKLNKKFFSEFENLSSDDDNNISDIPARCEANNSINFKKNEDINNNESQIHLIYNIILIIICSLPSFQKFEIIANDFYSDELLFYIKDKLKLFIPLEYNNFHILNLLYSLIKKINLLNAEINSLDDIAFKKIVKNICKNDSLTSIKLSFFSSNVSYLILGLIKIYEKNKSLEELENYALNERYSITYEKFENKMVNDLSINFIENLDLLFQIIKNKNDIEVLGFNFDIPNILINNKNYIMPIYKFIINILLLIDYNEKQNKNKVTKLTILSKFTEFDGRKQTNINNFFKSIELYKNSRNLKELNIQFQFYQIIHLKNLISPNLTILNIGDLDLPTFTEFVNYLSSYEFSNKSSLNSISIKLNNKIIEFDVNIKFILQKLFYIKIKNLLELKLFSNIIIKNPISYLQLINLTKYNWIPFYLITLNKKSKDSSISYYSDNIEFLAFSTIEKNSSNAFKLVKKKENNDTSKKNYTNDDEVFWMLKYIFGCKYFYYNLTFFQIKYIIFNIAKFLYPAHKATILHEIK